MSRECAWRSRLYSRFTRPGSTRAAESAPAAHGAGTPSGVPLLDAGTIPRDVRRTTFDARQPVRRRPAFRAGGTGAPLVAGPAFVCVGRAKSQAASAPASAATLVETSPNIQAPSRTHSAAWVVAARQRAAPRANFEAIQYHHHAVHNHCVCLIYNVTIDLFVFMHGPPPILANLLHPGQVVACETHAP